ncbi:NADP-dependent 3-hydroxy acid dehydrogenase YdfG [Cyclonatronum proteinivorum]|uniref:NADP-dependent 3-hydroxy acid dehydrogenase YdfG n=1 Tax=Cyclonatronum proteinivorum TaxID=1457365 RepID=A0A345ULI9_9BACT|nr:SDR family oxidoreductase [Cyclonatronum proteinivorum]AXJ01341.1 NADP-dependent 3-hydroxy acid dehydrogenase YdfG [Cyclonatronum proteinivorum]
MNITDKNVIITGASSGIGAAFAKAIIEKGGVVYGIARRQERLQELQRDLGDRFHPVVLDITDEPAVSTWVEATFSAGNYPDALINNAGLGKFGNVEDLSLDDWHTMMNVNLNGVFYLTRKIVPMMKQNPAHCHIINIASVAGLMGNPTISGYNVTKFGLRGFSDALFKELRYDAIKVTCVFPGSIATEFFDLAGSSTHPNMMQAQDVASTIVHILETPDNFLIDEITLRPLNPKRPE